MTDERERPDTTTMNAEERAAVRQAGAEDARRSRVRQGLPERVGRSGSGCRARHALAAVPAPRPPSESRSPLGNQRHD
jgi:hypothetical protein